MSLTTSVATAAMTRRRHRAIKAIKPMHANPIDSKVVSAPRLVRNVGKSAGRPAEGTRAGDMHGITAEQVAGDQREDSRIVEPEDILDPSRSGG